MTTPDLSFRTLILAQYLAGVRTPVLIAQALSVPDREEEVHAYLRSADFNTALLRAKKDMAASVVDAIKTQLHRLLKEYLTLGLDCGDPRVRAQVLKDLLDRGGTGATAKVALTTPDAYRKAIEEYLEPSPGGTSSDDDPEPVAERGTN